MRVRRFHYTAVTITLTVASLLQTLISSSVTYGYSCMKFFLENKSLFYRDLVMTVVSQKSLAVLSESLI